MSTTDDMRLGPLRREALKLLAQRRTYIGAGLLMIIPITIAVMTKLSANPHGEGEGGLLFMRLLTRSGLYFPLATLFMVETILLPIAAAMVGGFLVAGEAEQGTLRTVLVRPVRRGAMLFSKWVVGMAYLGIVLALLTVVGLIAGGLLFGFHPIVGAPSMEGPTLSMHLTEIPVVRALALTALANVVVLGYLAVFMTLALLISTMTDSSLTATMVAVVSTVVLHAVMQFSYLDGVRPYWFWTHFTGWFGLFTDPMDGSMIWKALLAFGAYTLVPCTAAWYVFRRRDILS